MNTKTQDKHLQDDPGPTDPNASPVDPNQLPTVQQPGALQVMDFGEDAGLGMENTTADEFTIPFITVLQTNSPQCDENEGSYIPGAKAGMFYNTGTGELINGKDGFIFVPVARDHNFAEFTPRNLGGGFVGTHAPDDDLVIMLRAKFGKFGKMYTSDRKMPDGQPAEGTEVQENYLLYGLIADEATGLVQRAILLFKSTQIKKYRNLMGRIDSIRYMSPDSKPIKPPLWAHRWRVTTTPESNAKGKFHGIQIRLAAQNEDGTEKPLIHSLIKRSEPLYAQGREFYDLVEAGKIKADYAGAQKAEGEGDAADDKDTDIPM